MRFDPGAFYESVYQYVCLHIDTYGIVIPIPRKKPLKTLSAYSVLLTQATLKQIHQKNLYLDIDDPDDEALGVLEVCVAAAEHSLPETFSQKTVIGFGTASKRRMVGNIVHQMPRYLIRSSCLKIQTSVTLILIRASAHRAFYHTSVSPQMPLLSVRKPFDTYGISTKTLVLTVLIFGLN